MNKVLLRLNIIALVAMAIALVYFAYLLFWPFRPFRILNSPLPVQTPTVADGSFVRYKVSYCKTTDIPGTASKQLVNLDSNIVFFLPEETRNSPTGCNTIDNRTTLIPIGTPAGRYKIRATVTHHVNPLRSITINYETQPFIVTGGGSATSLPQNPNDDTIKPLQVRP